MIGLFWKSTQRTIKAQERTAELRLYAGVIVAPTIGILARRASDDPRQRVGLVSREVGSETQPNRRLRQGFV